MWTLAAFATSASLGVPFNEESAHAVLAAGGMTLDRYQEATDNMCRFFIAHAPQNLTVVSCGGSDNHDDFSNAKFRSGVGSELGVEVHDGFLQRAMQVTWPDDIGPDVLVTGYGLGGSVASLVAARMLRSGIPNVTCITFGAPPVGGYRWQELVETQWGGRFINILHEDDPSHAVFTWDLARSTFGAIPPRMLDEIHVEALVARFSIQERMEDRLGFTSFFSLQDSAGAAAASMLRDQVKRIYQARMGRRMALLPHGRTVLWIKRGDDEVGYVEVNPVQLDRLALCKTYRTPQNGMELYLRAARSATPELPPDALEQLLRQSTEGPTVADLARDLELSHLLRSCEALRDMLAQRLPSAKLTRVHRALADVMTELEAMTTRVDKNPARLIRHLEVLERAKAYLDGNPPSIRYDVAPLLRRIPKELSGAAAARFLQECRELPPLHDDLLTDRGATQPVSMDRDSSGILYHALYHGQEVEVMELTYMTPTWRAEYDVLFRWGLRWFPGVQQILAVRLSGCKVILVRERGRSLEEVLRWPFGRSLPLLVPVAQAMAFMTANGRSHRHIEASNLILVGSNGLERICVTDFRGADVSGSFFSITKTTPSGWCIANGADYVPHDRICKTDMEQLQNLILQMSPMWTTALPPVYTEAELIEMLETAAGVYAFRREMTRLGVESYAIDAYLLNPEELNHPQWGVDANLAAFLELDVAAIPALRRALTLLNRACEAEHW